MKRRDFFLCLFLFALGILSRLPLIEKMQSHMDGPTYSIALVNYSFEQDNPTAPGYPLYIGLGKVLLSFTGDPHVALLLVSVLFSGIGAVLFYLVGRAMYSRISGIISSVFFLSSPAIFFFGLTPYGYIVVLVMTTLLAWIVFEISFHKKQFGLLLGAMYAISLGVRPQEAMLTLPLFLFGIFYLKRTEIIRAAIAFIAVFFLWFLPFSLLTGGIPHLFEAMALASRSALSSPSVTYFLRKKFELGSGFFLTLGLSGMVLFIGFLSVASQYLKSQSLTTRQIRFIVFSIVWFLPPLLFNLFVRTEHAGYQFDYLIYFMFFVSLFLARYFRNHPILIQCIVATLVLTNLLIFFYDRDPQRERPYRQTSLHYSDIRRNDYELSTKIKYITLHYSPRDAIIFSSTPFWKQYMYHLPKYAVYSLDGFFSSDKRYASLVRYGHEWKRIAYTVPSLQMTIPKGTRTLILLDTDSCLWSPQGATKIHFPQNTCITNIPVKNNRFFKFGYHTIKLLS